MADICSTCALPVEICVCEDIAREQQEIRVRIEKRRYGKLMTVLEGLGSDIDIPDLLKTLKTKCATGGTYKDGAIELQGNHTRNVKVILGDTGFPVGAA